MLGERERGVCPALSRCIACCLLEIRGHPNISSTSSASSCLVFLSN